jgi:Flp pilus assembly protein TadD
LAKAYLLVQQLDSVAKYADLISEADMSIEGKEKAGNYYYEAFGFATDDTRARKFGEKVRELLGEVVETNPDNLSAKSKIAMTYISSSSPMQGILMLREVLEKDPENNEALYNMGILSMQSGQYDKAVERLEKLLSVDSENIQAMFYLGVSYKELGNKEKAKAWLIKAKETENDPAVSAAVDSYLQELN